MASKIDDILERFDRTSDQFFSKDEFRTKLKTGKKLRIKYGVDVTAPTLHIGHAVNLWLMRYMQNLGHKVIFVIGDFTTRIGDPTGRNELRPVIPREDIDRNAKEFIDQARMVLRFDDPDLIEIRRNSEWLESMTLQEILDLLSHVTHARLISRDMFQLRLAEGKEIHMHEMLYPVLQGWDSVMVKSDMTIIGSDQLFNEMMGRLFQEKNGQKPQTIITTKITPGIDGKAKQSKSLGNYIGLGHTPRDKFGRVMSIPDDLIDAYFRIYTDAPLDEIDRMKKEIMLNPRDAKMKLAYAIVGLYHGHDIAAAERDWFENVISKGHVPNDIPALHVISPHIIAIDLIHLAMPENSKSDNRRLMTQGAVVLNGEKLSKPTATLTLKPNDILKVGKRNWFRIEIVKLNEFETEELLFKPMLVKDIDLIQKYIPAWDIVKYIGKLPGSAKVAADVAREVFKKVLSKPEPKDEWVWKIMSKATPEKIIGVAYLRTDSAHGNQNIWLLPDHNSKKLAQQAMSAVNEHAFNALGFQKVVFKDAFAHAAVSKEMETLRKQFLAMDPTLRNRDEPMGAWGFTKEGWQLMKDQFRNIATETQNVVSDDKKTRVLKEERRQRRLASARPKTPSSENK